ncbi:GNAT family N-acetyltransferase [Paractinoplanes lichenicola]|uniref:GNAT family N-acetyltransferase n=1 Tax=Paractinoplanes lichenicola TaxID=2802976 RepID=A0ABS1VXB3_9ACTN|nr:GNAT family N-acetyltransferase [Actinoplanes lichenicola]MBL7259063.1 GNAT family N-acetyltransferase [Actinoplanes lichenicola]
MTVTRLRDEDDPATWEAAARLLDDYRQHYGANPAPEAAAAWLREQIDAARARVYLAVGADPGSADGICTIAVVPAALTLRTVWLVRDLYVRPAARRRGLARALLDVVADEAAASGAHRLSLQTESANGRALELYTRGGFTALPEVTVMDNVL